MELNINGKTLDEPISDRLITNSLYTHSEKKNSSIILSKSSMEYIQTSGTPSKGFKLEYQDGAISEHYKCLNDNLSADLVAKVFKSYFAQNDNWKSAVPWEKAAFSALTGGSKGKKIVNILYGLAIAGYLIYKYFFST